jgi:hypothetical protein
MQLITSVTPTICRLMGVPPPGKSTTEVIDPVVADATRLGGLPVERVLVYAPDALGETLYKDYAEDFEGVAAMAPIQVLLRSVSPTVTPVCFGSMFTGALPETHGIRKYEKPVLSCDTIFDALAKAGKKVAIVAVEECSIAKIFLEREIDYFIEEDDQLVNAEASRLIEISAHDFILVYNQDYDDAMHASKPRTPEALTAMRNHLRDFERLSKKFISRNKGRHRLVVFSPDHGVHVDEDTGRGSHGLDTPEDVEVRSFWGIYPKGD